MTETNTTLLTRQREFVDPVIAEKRDYESDLSWLILRDAVSGNDVSFNLHHYGYTVFVWERPDDRD